jgi:hypothetical protein
MLARADSAASILSVSTRMSTRVASSDLRAVARESLVAGAANSGGFIEG